MLRPLYDQARVTLTDGGSVAGIRDLSSGRHYRSGSGPDTIFTSTAALHPLTLSSLYQSPVTFTQDVSAKLSVTLTDENQRTFFSISLFQILHNVSASATAGHSCFLLGERAEKLH